LAKGVLPNQLGRQDVLLPKLGIDETDGESVQFSSEETSLKEAYREGEWK